MLFHDQGAEIIRVARDGDKRSCRRLLVSSRRQVGHDATDLATILDRKR